MIHLYIILKLLTYILKRYSELGNDKLILKFLYIIHSPVLWIWIGFIADPDPGSGIYDQKL